MPSKFQNSDNTSSFSRGRNIFLNTETNKIPTNNFSLKKEYEETKSITNKFIPIQSSDQHIQNIKNRAIGRGTLAKKEGNNHVASFSGNNNTKSVNYQNTQQALRRLRNRGYVVPPKVIANKNRNIPGDCL